MELGQAILHLGFTNHAGDSNTPNDLSLLGILSILWSSQLLFCKVVLLFFFVFRPSHYVGGATTTATAAATVVTTTEIVRDFFILFSFT